MSWCLEVGVITNSHKVTVAMLPYFEGIGNSCYQVTRTVPFQGTHGSQPVVIAVRMHAFDVLVLALRFNQRQVAQNKESRKYFNIKSLKTEYIAAGNISTSRNSNRSK
jgi:hypothetical protein